MKLIIKLLSDLCVSSGESYNSFVDIDAIYDDYGMPFIPAKRLKGCIREAALELVEWGVYEKSVYESLFGKEGKEKTLFSLDNGYLKNYDQMIRELSDCDDKGLVHPQRVLELYSYTRTQTSLTEDGVAENGSLRTMRVINKGLVFEAEITEIVKLSDEQYTLLENAISMVKHIGNSRTRGLGLVELELEKENSDIQTNATVSDTYGAFNKINYTITLKSPLLCKSAEGSQEKTHDYIEGGKIIGLLAQNLSQEDFLKLMNYGSKDGIIASNAYISRQGERYTPVSASFQKKKDEQYSEEGTILVQDMLVTEGGDIQRVPFGHCYVDNNGFVKTVDTEINYHHRRPNDKGVGKANGEDDSAFYQLESIRKGQQFSGYILANEEQSKIVEKALLRAKKSRMGYGRNAEYGNVEVSVSKVEKIENRAANMTQSFVVKLNSAVILYNEFGCPCADVNCLKKYLANALGIDVNGITLNKAFLNYETVGGFNVTWNRRKPIFTVLGKGTVCSFGLDKETDISKLDGLFIGERVAEGFGEIEVSESIVSDVTLRKQMIISMKESEKLSTDILLKLKDAKAKTDAHEAGVQAAIRFVQDNKSIIKSDDISATLNKLILIVRDEVSLQDMEKQVDGIEDKKKQKKAKTMLGSVKGYDSAVEHRVDKEEINKHYLKGFLNHIKYVVYAQKGE